LKLGVDANKSIWHNLIIETQTKAKQMTKTAALKKYAEVYAKHIAPKAACLDQNMAVVFAVQDILNQVKGQSEEYQIAIILDEAAYIEEKSA
jgi:hypothetical protein